MRVAMDVPQLVEGLRRKHGSINAAARACGMPEGTLHRLHENPRNPRLDTLRKIARGYDEPLVEIIRRLEDGKGARDKRKKRSAA